MIWMTKEKRKGIEPNGSMPEKCLAFFWRSIFNRQNQRVVVRDADGEDVEGVVFDIYVLHRAFEREHRLRIPPVLLHKAADLAVGDLARHKEAEANENRALAKLDVAKQRRDEKIEGEKIDGNENEKRRRCKKADRRHAEQKDRCRDPNAPKELVVFWLEDPVFHFTLLARCVQRLYLTREDQPFQCFYHLGGGRFFDGRARCIGSNIL